ncbi:MerR family transcriptional regulator [Janibacter sp. G368]|uniref:MerR family transcriptional regulator n=1 Tax=Janibacter sp. G368 TaxID=3420441 RepID=UPI003D0841B4
MRIGELARRTGLAPSAIRYYEERDMFSPGQVRRLPNGYRDYTPEAEQRQALVLAGRAAGFGLDDMRTRMQHWSTMSDAERADILRDQLEVLDARIGELDRSRREIAAVLGVLSTRLGG